MLMFKFNEENLEDIVKLVSQKATLGPDGEVVEAVHDLSIHDPKISKLLRTLVAKSHLNDDQQKIPILPGPPLSGQLLNSIPPEIWGKIFGHAYCAMDKTSSLLKSSLSRDDFSASDTPGSLNPRHILLIIRNVCTRWRETVQSLSELWSDILLHDCWKVPQEARKDPLGFILARFSVLSNILRFSADRPLRIVISTYSYDTSHNPAALVHHAMLILAQQSRRWKSFYIRDCQYQSISRALSSSISILGITEFPLCEQLHYEWWGREVDENHRTYEEIDLPPLGSRLPQLRWLSAGPAFPVVDPHIQLPLSRLEKVVFHDMQDVFYRPALPHLQSAVEITITWTFSFHNDEEDLPPLDDLVDFTLPQLQKLTVSEWDDQFFAFMHAPDLRHLCIHNLVEQEIEIADFVVRSTCTIEVFSLLQYLPNIIRGSDIAFLLSLLPGLRKLNVDINYQGNTFDLQKIGVLLEALSPNEVGTFLCPTLQKLFVSYSFYQDPIPLVKLVQVAEGRWAATRSGEDGLRGVGLIPYRRSKIPEYGVCFEKIERMKGEGLDVGYVY